MNRELEKTLKFAEFYHQPFPKEHSPNKNKKKPKSFTNS